MVEVYCFFCENCGNETLSFDALNSCPYCHAHHDRFQLLAKTAGQEQDEFRGIIEKAKSSWIEEFRNGKKRSSRRKKAR